MHRENLICISVGRNYVDYAALQSNGIWLYFNYKSKSYRKIKIRVELIAHLHTQAHMRRCEPDGTNLSSYDFQKNSFQNLYKFF